MVVREPFSSETNTTASPFTVKVAVTPAIGRPSTSLKVKE